MCIVSTAVTLTKVIDIPEFWKQIDLLVEWENYESLFMVVMQLKAGLNFFAALFNSVWSSLHHYGLVQILSTTFCQILSRSTCVHFTC